LNGVLFRLLKRHSLCTREHNGPKASRAFGRSRGGQAAASSPLPCWDEAAKLKIGPGLDPTTRIGPLISEEQFQRVTGYLASGEEEGAEAITGGKRHGNEGYFIQPTVLTRTKPSMKVVREEIFGPVVCAMLFNDVDLERIARPGQRHGVRPGSQHLDPRYRRCSQTRAQAQGRLGLDQRPQLQ
jgi:hypothetical protein